MVDDRRTTEMQRRAEASLRYHPNLYEVTVMAASRATLRILPILGFEQDTRALEEKFFFCCRALSWGFAAVQLPERGGKLKGKIKFEQGFEMDLPANCQPCLAAFSTMGVSGAVMTATPRMGETLALAETAVFGAGYIDVPGYKDGDLKSLPLWEGFKVPDQCQEGWHLIRSRLQENDDAWSFWLNWYEAVVRGQFEDWAIFQTFPSDITAEDWDVGVSHVSAKIQQIRAKIGVSSAIARFENGNISHAIAQERHTIGGNNPPEDMQIEPQIVQETTIIWATVDELKAETEQEAPDKPTVLRIIETLGRALKAILAWCAQKGDLSVDTLIKWGIPLGGAAVLANPKLVADVIEAAKAWVPYLP